MNRIARITVLTVLSLPAFFFAQTRSQTTSSAGNKVFLNLPGMTEKVNTQDVVEKLVAVKRLPIQKKENETENFKLENDIVKDFSKYLRDLDTRSKALYDYQSPFGEMLGDASDKKILEAIAGRRAKKDAYRVTVFQTAKPDSFMSASTPRNKVFPAGQFTISINGEKTVVRFGGGTLAQFANTIRESAGDRVDVKMINDTATTSILVVSGRQTGEKNKMIFDGDLSVLFDTGILKKGEDKTEEFAIDLSGVQSRNSQPIAANKTSVRLTPNTDGELSVRNQNIAVREDTTLYFKGRVNRFDLDALTNDSVTPPEISLMEGVTISNVTVSGGSLITLYEEKRELPPVVSNFTEIFTLVFTDGSTKTFFIDSDGSYSNSLSTYRGKTLDKILVQNANTDREIALSDVRVLSVLETGGPQPKNAVSRASDAIISFDGVEVRRDKNTIDDLVEGVTLNLLNESPDPVRVTIDHNYQKVQDALLSWVDSYNKAMEYLSILTKPNLDKTPLNERTPANLKLGVFQTETTFLVLKNRLRNGAANAYPTDLGRELAVLDQIGIFTKKAGGLNTASEEWEAAKMGLLSVEPDKLETALKTKFDAVAQLFANDTTGDKVKNTGVSVTINQDLKLVLGSGNFIDRRIALNDSKIKTNRREIEDMNRSLGDYEMDLRRKYGKLNQVLSETDQKQKWMNSQFKAQQGAQ